MIAIARAEPGTNRRAQLRGIALREARLRGTWLDILRSWNGLVDTDSLRDVARAGTGDADVLLRGLETATRPREAELVRGLVGPIERAELEEFTTPLGPVAVDTLARAQVGDLVRDLFGRARDNLRELLVVLMREGPTDDVLASIASSTGLTRRQTIAVQNLRRRLLEEGVSRATAGRRATDYAERVLRRRARLIARTEAVRFTSALVEARALQAGNMVKQWVSARDGAVEELCLSLDNGQQVPAAGMFQGLSGGIARPPAHPGCRCILEITRITEGNR